MQDIVIEIVTDIKSKSDIMFQCDAAYTESIVARTDFEEYLAKLHEHGMFFVAMLDDEIAGYAVVYANDSINHAAYIPLICIKTEFQGQGIGSLLLSKCCLTANRLGMSTMGLAVLRVDKLQKKFYEKQGFKVISETEDRYNMTRSLDSLE